MRAVLPRRAVAEIRDGHTIYIHGGAATPTALLTALAERGPKLKGVTTVGLHLEGPCPHLAPELAGHIRHRALFIGPTARDAVNEGRADYVPIFLSDIPLLISRGILSLDCAFINVSPPDAHGYCSLGPSVDATLAAVRSARTVIAQINSAMPRTLGDSFVHVREIDLMVEVAQPPHEHPAAEIGETERQIGALVADLIPDGATLQLGIGSIPAAVGAALGDKTDLGIHTELFTDTVVDLVEAGVVTGAAKEINTGKIVSSFVLGTPRLYRFIDNNPMVEMRPVDYTNDTAVIRRFRKMVAINSAIEVDLSGQVVADSIGRRLYSGVGGQMDFIRGAALAEEGRAIIALPSTAAGGAVSRITASLQPGAGVVTTRAHVRTVVTEWGVAELFGRSLAERAHALIQIAHPAFRDELLRAAGQMHLDH
ncbi:MAG TPA: acetyl-CoA hydrolase/transferase C-terminal domain-containing protein [Candidatus Limnocylindria bacterium]|jgi:acyl-CoA hydrolase|nr:acetyl-CoA hydrolase/transferase C-terminal domain-containing protein [Candidatus Limnocylindria bacterium]